MPSYASDTLYAPVAALPDVVSEGDTLAEPVTVVTSGPLHVYVGLPAPPAVVAVSVITPPTHNGLLALELTPDTDGCALSVYTAVATGAVVVQPVPE